MTDEFLFFFFFFFFFYALVHFPQRNNEVESVIDLPDVERRRKEEAAFARLVSWMM